MPMASPFEGHNCMKIQGKFLARWATGEPSTDRLWDRPWRERTVERTRASDLATAARFADSLRFDPDTNSRSNYNHPTDALHRTLWPIRNCVDLGGRAGVRGVSNAGYATAASGTAKLRDEKPMKP